MEYAQRMEELARENPFMSKTDIAYHLVQEDILEGRLSGGARINQEVLSARLNLSRSPIREALNRLVKDGYLEKSATSGYTVYDMRLEDYIALNDFRTMLEIFAAQLAAKHISDGEIEILRENIKKTETITKSRDVEAFLKLDEEFHITLVQAANNPHLWETYSHYSMRFHLFRIRTVTVEILNSALKWHNKIYQAVLNGDVEAATETTRLHRETTVNTAMSAARGRHDW